MPVDRGDEQARCFEDAAGAVACGASHGLARQQFFQGAGVGVGLDSKATQAGGVGHRCTHGEDMTVVIGQRLIECTDRDFSNLIYAPVCVVFDAASSTRCIAAITALSAFLMAFFTSL